MLVSLPFSSDFSDGSTHGWSGGLVVPVSGQSFSKALQWNSRDLLDNTIPAIPGQQIAVSGWLNAANLASHPSDGNLWTVQLGVQFTSGAGVNSWAGAGIISPGTGWTYVSGIITTPADSVSMTGWLQIAAGNPLPAGLNAQAALLSYRPTPNGWNIVAVPSKPGFRDVTFAMRDSVGIVQSPFTMQTQVQSWPGADRLEASVTLPPMTRQQAAPWIAFLMECRGQANVFMLSDPLAPMPAGHVQGVPIVDGSVGTNNSVFSTTLFTKGWVASQFRLLLPGDYLQVGNRLYTVLDTVNSDANGNAQISIWPSLREQPADSQLITLHNASGLFRLADNARQFDSSYLRTVGISFKAIEAR